MDAENKITYFAKTDARNKQIPFGIKQKDRSRHVYVIGKTGMGKSTLLENMAVQDIRNGNGICFIDPHGKTADMLLEYVPEERIKDVLYLAPFDTEHPISFNVLEDVGEDKRHLVVSGLMSAFKKIWGEETFSARMEHILSNTLRALMEYPGATLLSVNRMYADKVYRKKVIDSVTDTSVRSFWLDEFAKYTERFAAEATPAIQNKIGQFTSNPLIRNIVGQPKSSFDLRQLMDDGKILVINLSKGRVGEDNANLLGSMLVTKIYLAAMSRADLPEKELDRLPTFFLYVDEFQSFANESFADILSEARKYRLAITLAHQYIEQMSDEVKAAVFGNVGTMVSFRVGAFDAEVLEREFAPKFTAEDMVSLGFAQIYLKLMIDGVSSQPFSATTLLPIARPDTSYKTQIIEHSRQAFAQSKSGVEKEIKEWYAEGQDSGGDDRNKRNDSKSSAPPRKPRDTYTKPREVRSREARSAETVVEKTVPSVVTLATQPSKKNPFKKIKVDNSGVLRVDGAIEKKRMISLKEAVEMDKYKEKKVKGSSRGPTEEKLKTLRETLAAVGGDLSGSSSKETSKRERPVEKKDYSQNNEDQTSSVKKEISKEVLQNLLRIDS